MLLKQTCYCTQDSRELLCTLQQSAHNRTVIMKPWSHRIFPSRIIKLSFLVAVFVVLNALLIVRQLDSSHQTDAKEISPDSEFVSPSQLLWNPMDTVAAAPSRNTTIRATTSPPGQHPVVTTSEVQHKVLMTTFVFGEQAANKRYLRMFVDSAKYSGVDVAIVGHPPLPFDHLPRNVLHVPATWDELVDRVRDFVLNGTEPTELRRLSDWYKVIDFKPLFAHLFPEQVQGYDWWGHLDNDLILGNLRHYLTHKRLDRFDVITNLETEYTSGPFTLYRNTPVVNELFRLAKRPLMEIFGTSQVRVFDEWGGSYHSVKQDEKYASTMSGIIEHHRKRLGIRWFGGLPSVWDGFCRQKSPGICSQCTLRRRRQQQVLIQDCFGQKPCHAKVAFCHFQYSKETMEESLAQRMETLIDQGQYRVNFLDGFASIENSTTEG